MKNKAELLIQQSDFVECDKIEMLPGSVDPRRPDKQQRYKPPPASNNAAPGEDLTPDYMNILDPHRKSMQTRSDRFKVVKIESTEPFKRGRWECMDFLDQSYNRVFQRNSNKQVSSETHTHVSPVHTNNSDLQSSMLQIFYRQNNNIIENNSVGVTKPCSKEYQNHVLRPGMVSSSLVGVKYPFELNFEDKSPPTNCSTVYDCHGVCDNQKFQSMSNDFSNLTVYQNLNQDLINNGQYIEKTVQQAQNLSELYQEQIIAYVDNSPQRKVTNFLPEYDKKTNFNQQLDQQLTQIIENPISNDVPEVLYHPNPRFQEDDQYLPQTESPQNLFQNDSVISTNSCNNIKIEPQSCEQETMMLPQENLIMHTIPRCPDVKDLVACSNHNRNNQSIDDKIEQLMDLVKKHLKYAVLEDVNVMKQQILILKGRVAQLEYENALLRSFEDQNKPREDI